MMYGWKSDSVDSLRSLVQEFRRMRKDGMQVELEAKLGTSDERNHFEVGLNQDMFSYLKGWIKNMETNDMHDYFFTLRSRMVRSRVEMNRYDFVNKVTNTYKSRIKTVVLLPDEDGSTLSVKFTLSLESPVTSDLPGVVKPEKVRLIQRSTHQVRKFGRLVWAYDFSDTWMDQTREKVEELQMNDEGRHEVELELVDEGDMYLSKHDDDYITDSFLIKLKELLSCTNIHLDKCMS